MTQTRFQEFDDADHPANIWWQKHGQYMLSGGGRREFIWACRGWIAREQLYDGVPVTGDSLTEKSLLEKLPALGGDSGASPAMQPQCQNLTSKGQIVTVQTNLPSQELTVPRLMCDCKRLPQGVHLFTDECQGFATSMARKVVADYDRNREGDGDSRPPEYVERAMEQLTVPVAPLTAEGAGERSAEEILTGHSYQMGYSRGLAEAAIALQAAEQRANAAERDLATANKHASEINTALAEARKALQAIADMNEMGCGCECKDEDCCLKVGEDCSYCAARAALAQKSSAQKSLEWCAVKDQLPEEFLSKLVLIWHDQRKQMHIGFQTTSYEWCGMDGIVLKIKPTHWRPLPEPPKEAASAV